MHAENHNASKLFSTGNSYSAKNIRCIGQSAHPQQFVEHWVQKEWANCWLQWKVQTDPASEVEQDWGIFPALGKQRLPDCWQTLIDSPSGDEWERTQSSLFKLDFDKPINKIQ